MKEIDYTLFGMNHKEYEEKIPIVKNAMVITCEIFDCIDIIRGKEEYVWCGNRIVNALTDQDRIARQEEREKAKEAFCLATCKGKLHRSTCTSLGTCEEYDDFCAIIRKAMMDG